VKKCLFLLIFILSVLHAEEENFNPQAVKPHNRVIDQRENYFQTSTPYKISPNVNPITGDLIEEEMDLVVAGCEPLSVRRFYNHSAFYESHTGGWRYNPEFFFVANLEWPQQEIFAAVGEFNGNIVPFNPSSCSCSFNFTQGFSHFEPNGQTHPLNTKINFNRYPGKKKHWFLWRGEIIDGSGAKRFFSTEYHCWLSYLEVRLNVRDVDIYTPNCWTPYQFHVSEERRPNGNIICYSTTRWIDRKYYPTPPHLSGITAYNADKTKVLGSISFQYNRNKKDNVTGFSATGSDGRQAVYHNSSSPFPLQAAYTPDKPTTCYAYQGTWVNRAEKPQGRVITTEYNGAGKVSAQYAPVGPNAEMCPIGRYVYHDRDTESYDAEGNKTIYRFNEHKQVLSVETHQDGKPYCIDRFTWDTTTGNLLKKNMEDGSGHILQITEYTYDKNHNPIVERIGDGKEWHTIQKTFSEDGFNLKLTETDREGQLTRYRYIPNTNLLTSEIVYENNTPKKRQFHFYDNCAIRIKTIIDDGSTEDPSNLQGVTYRKITSITPKQATPCFGLPETVEEKTIETSGQEILLHKTVYTYTTFGKVLKEEHYDATGSRRYSITNTYDDRERLSSQIDPLGHKKSFAYDANNNLISITGPKPAQHKEITYDKTNRPVRIADWQTDGTILISEKKYDKLGRLIEEIDPCGHKTQFQYDALSRLVATLHPDGAIEKREYDPLNNLIKEIDPEGYETKKTYNCFGQVLSISYPDGTSEQFSYHPTGTLASHQDKNGALSLYIYDLFDHLIKTEHPHKTTVATWTPFQKISETDGDLTTTYTYDFAGRKIAEQKSYREIHYLLDSLGRVHTTQEGNTELIEEHNVADQLTEKRKKAKTLQFQENYAYDESGNCTEVMNSKGATLTTFNTDDKPLTLQDPLGFTTHYVYTYKDFFTQTTTNPKGIQTQILHDSRGRETKYLKLNQEIIQQYENHYNQNGNKTAIIHTLFSGTTPIKTITHQWEYGPMGRLERFIEAGIRETRYHYDDKGRLKTLIKPDGRSLSHEYDHLGRLSRFYAQEFDYRYAYDHNDRVTTIYDKISKTETQRTYDPLSNILEERLANGLVLKNVYDQMGRRIQCILPDASTIDYLYDGHYLYAVKRGDYTHTYSKRNLEAEIIQAILPDAEQLLIERDKLGRYASYHAPYYTATDYAYDGQGNLLCYRDSETEYRFAYDDLDQLLSENDHTYHCDSLYNRLKKDELDYTIDPFCQVNCDGNSTYEYNACGNLISDGVRKYYYDSLDRLITVENGNHRTEYTYDPFNRRLSKIIFSNGKTQHLRYLWDGENEIGIVDEKNSIQELRILGEGLGAEIGAAVLYEIQGKPYIPIHDHRGCVVVLVDLETKKIEHYRYSAFGEELTGNTFSPWRFASKRVDAETDLVFFGRRYYHPSLGRFITQDPQGFEEGPNLYAYLKNCPMADLDPYGLYSWREMWSDSRDFCYGAGSYAWGGVRGVGYGMGKVGEWMHADFQYEHFNDRSFFQDKSYRAIEAWKSLGRAAWDDPLGMLAPGIMEAWRNPRSAEAWGKAAMDVGLFGLTGAKMGGTVANIGRAGRVGEEFSTIGRLEYAAKNLINFDSAIISNGISVHRLKHIFGKPEHALESFVSKFGSQEKAFNAVQHAANQAFKSGKLTPNAQGILPTGDLGNIINVGGMNIRLIGGRVENGQVIISSFSRKGL
jgi:RHS repeat-associated protein